MCSQLNKFHTYLIYAFLLLVSSSCNPILFSMITKKDIKKDILVLENEEGRRVVYLGMTHLGRKGYYESVTARVDSLRKEGYIVLYEGVAESENDTVLRKFRKVTGLHLTDLRDVDNKTLKRVAKISHKYEHQVDYDLGIQAEDINADYSIDSLVYFYEEIKPIVLTECDWKTPLLEEYKCKDTVYDSRFTMIQKLRNDKVIEEVKKHKEKDIVILYGKGHRFFIHAGIRDLGYKLIEGKLRAF